MLSAAKHLASVRPFHAKTQSQLLRCAQDDSEGPRMTARQTSPRMSRCRPGGPAALGGRIRMRLTPFGTLRLRFFPQPAR